MAVLLPTSLAAYLKLRRRDLSSILEGSGWAVNGRMWLTRHQARGFTYRPRHARGLKGLGLFLRKADWLLAVLALGLVLYLSSRFGLFDGLSQRFTVQQAISTSQ